MIHQKALENLLQFIYQDNLKVMVLVGNAGIGKTFLCHELIQHLQKNYFITTTSMYVDLLDNNNHRDDLVEYLIKSYPIDSSFIFIFDHWGEHGKLENLYHKYQLHRLQAKVIITCRLSLLDECLNEYTYFAPLVNQKLHKHLVTSLQLFELSPHDIQNLTSSNSYNILLQQPMLFQLAHNPLMLKFINEEAEYLNSSTVLLEKILDKWFSWYKYKYSKVAIMANSTISKEQYWQYCHELAKKMQLSKVSILYSQPRTYGLERNNGNSLIRLFGPFIVIDKYQYRWLAVGLIDYFASIKLNENLKSLENQQTYLQEESINSLNSTISNRINQAIITQRLMTSEVDMMQMYADLAQGDKHYKNFLFQLVFSSRNNTDMQIAAANAITALNYAKISFSGMDLSRVKITKANLSRAICDGTDFTDAELNDIDLSYAYLANAQFKRSKMFGIRLSRIPPIEQEHQITVLATSSNKKYLASGDAYGYVKLWDIDNLIKIATFKNWSWWKIEENKSRNRIIELSFNQDGQYLAVLSNDKRIRLWNTTNKKIIRTFHTDAQSRDSTAICISPNGELLASYNVSNLEIKIWCSLTGCLRIKFATSIADDYAKERLYTKIRFSSNGRFIYYLTKDGMYACQLLENKLEEFFYTRISSPNYLEVSAHGRWLSMGNVNSVKLYMISEDSINLVQEFNIAHSIGTQFSYNERYLIIHEPGIISMWNTITKEKILVHYESNYYIGNVQINFENTQLIYSSDNAILGHKIDIDMHILALTSASNMIDQLRQSEHWKIKNKILTRSYGREIKLSPGHQWLAIEENNLVKVVNISKTKLYQLPLLGSINKMLFDQTQQYLAICVETPGMSENVITIWELEKGGKILELKRNNMFSYHSIFRFSPDGQWFIYFASKNNMSVFRKTACLVNLIEKKDSRDFGSVDAYDVPFYQFLNDADFMVCDELGNIKIWSIYLNKIIKEVNLHSLCKVDKNFSMMVRYCRLSYNKRWLAISYNVQEKSLSRMVEANLLILSIYDFQQLFKINFIQYGYKFPPDQFRFNFKDEYIFVSIEQKVIICSIKENSLVQTIDIFSTSPNVEFLSNTKVIIKCTNMWSEWNIHDKKETYFISLHQISNIAPLCVKNACFGQAEGLSEENKKILKKEGAILSNSIIINAHEKRSAQAHKKNESLVQSSFHTQNLLGEKNLLATDHWYSFWKRPKFIVPAAIATAGMVTALWGFNSSFPK